jgi:hypothetical protein
MRSPRSLRQWCQALLPAATPCAHAAGADLLRALLGGFTVRLAQLARQADRACRTKTSRDRFATWLQHAAWDPETLYAGLPQLVRQVWHGRRSIPLLIDATDLAAGWTVLQVSLPFAGRALPLYRAVRRYQGAPETQAELLQAALAWLAEHLPGPHDRYILIMDRGFPSHALIRHLQAAGWRFVLRLKSNWKLTHPAHRGLLKDLHPQAGEREGRVQQWYAAGVLGSREKGEGTRIRHSQAHVVYYWEPGQQEPWFLVTSERSAARAVAFYRERVGIECEFRDLKGPFGLDQLAQWTDQRRVACFLAWVAVYEWRLAWLWLRHQLVTCAPELQVYGPLSWIRVTREWLARQLRLAARAALEGL